MKESPQDVVTAPDRHQPTFVAETLAGLRLPPAATRPGPRHGWTATVDGDDLTVTAVAQGRDAAMDIHTSLMR